MCVLYLEPILIRISNTSSGLEAQDTFLSKREIFHWTHDLMTILKALRKKIMKGKKQTKKVIFTNVRQNYSERRSVGAGVGAVGG